MDPDPYPLDPDQYELNVLDPNLCIKIYLSSRKIHQQNLWMKGS